MKIVWKLLWCVLLVQLVSTKGDEIKGCGGFLKSSASIDFSKVEIRLLTKQGSVKDKTDCSPSNGYYFLPIYDKGDYILRVNPPRGWTFEPKEIPISFNGVSDLCSQGNDINFSFKGFGITGKVQIVGQKPGAANVKVQLRPKGNNEEVSNTLTDNNGIFSFSPIIPGSYLIKLEKEKWHFNKAEHEVQVNVGNTELPDNMLLVTGFDVKGKVMSDGHPFGSINVLLYSDIKGEKVIPSEGVPKVVSNNPNYQAQPSSMAKSCSEKGCFTFKGLAPGKYLMKPYLENSALQYNIEPKEIEFEVTRDALEVSAFEVTGFSISGKVLSAPNGKGIGKAVIKLNGKQVAITNSDGSYTLSNIKASTYTIQVTAEDLQFTDHTIKISASNPTIPDIVVTAFKVCGTVINDQSHKVAITKHASTFHIEVDSESGSGNWCTYLPNGQFDINVLTSSEEKSKGIQFFPLKQTIEVNSIPVSGISFSQLKATITGDVKCLPDSKDLCNNVKISLNSLDSSNQVYSSNVQGNSYKFTDILPGRYEIIAQNPFACWENSKIVIDVKSAEEKVPTSFTQTGYKITVISSHSATMKVITRVENSVNILKEVDLKNGLNDFCMPNSGSYEVQFSSCHVNENNILKTISTGSSTPFTVTFERHRNGIKLTSDHPEEFVMELERGSEKTKVKMTEEGQVKGQYSYKLFVDLKNQEVVKFKPISESLLFEPTSYELIGGNDCSEDAFTFKGRKGLIVKGRIEPRIKNIKVTMRLNTGDELVELSNDKGEFKFGPIDPTLEYSLSAEKESYVFSEYDRSLNIFKAQKLCEIIVTVKDENNQKLNGVLLSLSGGQSYRKNLITGADGSINFHSLSPSQYFLKPMMKEYKFEPNSKMIEIKDGETINVEVIGKRVAYSVFGQVTSLNGEPFPNVVLEAVSEDCNSVYHQEESNSETNGLYRIRGLQPGCSYSVHLKKEDPTNKMVDRTIPSERQIEIIQSDVKDINIIAISPLGVVDVAARIMTTSNDHYKTLRIMLYKKGNADNPVYSQRVESPLNVKSKINPGIMVFFPRIPLDGKTYIIELTTSLSNKNYKYDLPVFQFQANGSSVFHEFFFNPEMGASDVDVLNQNSIAVLILIAIVAFAFLKQDMFIELVSMLFNKVSDIVKDLIEKNKRKVEYEQVPLNDRDLDSLAKSINDVRKRKPRKTT